MFETFNVPCLYVSV